MFTGEGSLERGRRDAHEGREAIERRARIEAEAASAVRNRLEKGSPSAGRRNFAGILNAMAAGSASKEMPGLEAIAAIRKGQRHAYKSAADHNRTYARLEKQGGLEGFNRLHPGSVGPDDARNERYVTPLAEGDTYQRVKDALGGVTGGGAAQRSSGEVEGIEPEFLLDVARMLLEAVQAGARRFPEGRRD
jgi:hypothetical protein